PTFRDELLESYKANRAPCPEDLSVQLPYVRRFCEELGITIVEKEGFEADDVIGTLARQGVESGLDVCIVSGDEDLFQLVNERVKVLKPPRSAKDKEESTLFDAEKVKASLGVGPERVVDWIALTGDPSDNIPGARPLPGHEPPPAPGAKKRSYIGPKGATELIQRFQTLEGALEHWQDAPKQSYRDALREFKNEALLSQNLATIHTEVPLAVSVRELRKRGENLAGLIPLCQELGFTSLLKEFMQEIDPAATAESAEPAEQLSTPESILEWTSKLAPSALLALAPRIEGEEAFSGKLIGLGLADGARLAFVPLDMDQTAPALAEALRPVLADPGRRKAAPDAKLLELLLRKANLHVSGIADDILLYSYLLDPLASSHGLADVLLRTKGVKLAASPAHAAAAVHELAQTLAPEVDRKGLKSLYEEIELPLAPVLAAMETSGIRINPAILGEMSSKFEIRLTELTGAIYELAGEAFDIDSPRQLGEILFGKLKLPGGKRLRKSGQYSTEAAALEAAAELHELPRQVLEYRTRAKLKSTYVDALPRYINSESLRVHTTFNAAGSRTGRLSSSNPNLQNIPVDDEFGALIRSAFAAEPGWRLIAADYSQIELRVLAHLSEDPVLIEAFSRDEDIHSRTAQELFGVIPGLQTREHRRMAKAINYGVIYGLSSFGLAQKTGTSKTEAHHYIDAYFQRHQRVQSFLRQCVEEARQRGEVRTLFGRLRPIPDIRSADVSSRNRAEREAMNTPLQGTAADLMKLAMVKVDARLKREARHTRLILTVHDELVLESPESEVPNAISAVREEMENVYPLRVPLRVDAAVGANWTDAK
ncbi:MAG: DNA polymerase I, partial [Terriglobia bacterium]